MRQLLNTLYVTTDGAYLRLEGETLVVMLDDEKRLQIPLHHLGSVVCFGNVNMSSALMARNAEDGRTTVWMNGFGRFRARVEGAVSGNILLRQAQHRAADDSVICLELGGAFIAGKIRNSRQVLLRSAREVNDDSDKALLLEVAKRLAINLRNLGGANNLDTVRGLEGDSARAYFDCVNSMIKPVARGDFFFDTRSRRPPRDAVNALLSFLYSLLLHDCRGALEAVGLDPQLGFLHSVRPGRHALALDLQEEFRAVFCDRLALTLINRGQLRVNDFDHHDGGSVLLNKDGRKTVLTAYQQRKQETLTHPFLKQPVEIGLLPILQARMVSRFLRNDIECYVPYLHK